MVSDIQTIVLDLHNKNNVKLAFKQVDENSRFLQMRLTNGGDGVDLTGSLVYIYVKKPDNTVVFAPCEIYDSELGMIIAPITQQMLAQVGSIKCEILVVGSGKLSFPIFNLSVDDSIYDGDAVESSNEFSALVTALDQVNTWDNLFETKYDGLESEYAIELTDTKLKVDEYKIDIDNKIDQTNTQLSKKITQYKNINEMILSEKATDSYVETLGYYSAGDGGESTYHIRNKVIADVNNGFTVFLNSGLVAELIFNDEVNIKQVGAVGDGVNNDTQYMKLLLNNLKVKKIFIPNGIYLLDSFVINRKVKIESDGFFTLHASESNIYSQSAPILKHNSVPNSTFITVAYSDVKIKGLILMSDSVSLGDYEIVSNIESVNGISVDIDNIYLSDLRIHGFSGNGLVINTPHLKYKDLSLYHCNNAILMNKHDSIFENLWVSVCNSALKIESENDGGYNVFFFNVWIDQMFNKAIISNYDLSGYINGEIDMCKNGMFDITGIFSMIVNARLNRPSWDYTTKEITDKPIVKCRTFRNALIQATGTFPSKSYQFVCEIIRNSNITYVNDNLNSDNVESIYNKSINVGNLYGGSSSIVNVNNSNDFFDKYDFKHGVRKAEISPIGLYVPKRVGLIWVDKTSSKTYISVGVSSNTDWVNLGVIG